jgi:hypothetical protein
MDEASGIAVCKRVQKNGQSLKSRHNVLKMYWSASFSDLWISEPFQNAIGCGRKSVQNRSNFRQHAILITGARSESDSDEGTSLKRTGAREWMTGEMARHKDWFFFFAAAFIQWMMLDPDLDIAIAWRPSVLASNKCSECITPCGLREMRLRVGRVSLGLGLNSGEARRLSDEDRKLFGEKSH